MIMAMMSKKITPMMMDMSMKTGMTKPMVTIMGMITPKTAMRMTTMATTAMKKKIATMTTGMAAILMAMNMVMIIQFLIAGPLHEGFFKAEMGFGVVHQIIEDPGHAHLGVGLAGQPVQIIDVVDDTTVLLVDQQYSQFVVGAPYDAHDLSPVCDG